MRGIEAQITRLFGVAPERVERYAAQMQSAADSINFPKTMLTDMHINSMLQRYPLNPRETFIGRKSAVDVLLEKQSRMLSDDAIAIEYLYPLRSQLAFGGHAAKHTFVVKIRPFSMHPDAQASNAERERAMLEQIAPLYRSLPGAEVSWGAESVLIADMVRETPVLIIALGKNSDSAGARDILVDAMRFKADERFTG